MSVLSTVYQFSYGLGSATSVRVSNTLGAGGSQGAATAAVAALIFVVRGVPIAPMNYPPPPLHPPPAWVFPLLDALIEEPDSMTTAQLALFKWFIIASI